MNIVATSWLLGFTHSQHPTKCMMEVPLQADQLYILGDSFTASFFSIYNFFCMQYRAYQSTVYTLQWFQKKKCSHLFAISVMIHFHSDCTCTDVQSHGQVPMLASKLYTTASSHEALKEFMCQCRMSEHYMWQWKDKCNEVDYSVHEDAGPGPLVLTINGCSLTNTAWHGSLDIQELKACLPSIQLGMPFE